MSRRLLETLNGGNRGPLRSWLDARGDEPRICWYPSAHGDFRDMLYFSREYALRHHGALLETPPPDIFLHTDSPVNVPHSILSSLEDELCWSLFIIASIGESLSESIRMVFGRSPDNIFGRTKEFFVSFPKRTVP